MPVIKCPDGKFRIGSGPCTFDSKEKATIAYRSYLAKKHGAKASQMEGIDVPNNLSEDNQEEVTVTCECLNCGHKMESSAHCIDLTCPECGGKMRRADRPGYGR